MKSEMNRWRKFFWVRTYIKPNLVLSEISEMKSEMNRWTDEENFFLVQTCIKLNLVLSEISEMKRWRVRWRDEQMKKNFFWVWTCIKPNLVSSEISEMKRWRVRWDEQMKKNFFWSEHVSSQIWCYLKLVRWRDEEWDEEMNRWKCFLGPNMYQVKSGVIWN